MMEKTATAISPETALALGSNWIGAHETANPSTSESVLSQTKSIIQNASLTVAEMVQQISDLQEELYNQQRRAEDAEKLSYTDKMTGLFNRAGFESALALERKRIVSNQSRGAVVVIADVDHLKWANDNKKLGPKFGDAIIQKTGNNMRISSRDKDTVARYGGDEIAALITDVDVSMDDEGALNSQAVNVIEHVTSRLNSETVTLHGKTIPVRATFGFSIMDIKTTPERVVDEAMRNMHAKKDKCRSVRGSAPAG